MISSEPEIPFRPDPASRPKHGRAKFESFCAGGCDCRSLKVLRSTVPAITAGSAESHNPEFAGESIEVAHQGGAEGDSVFCSCRSDFVAALAGHKNALHPRHAAAPVSNCSGSQLATARSSPVARIARPSCVRPQLTAPGLKHEPGIHLRIGSQHPVIGPG